MPEEHHLYSAVQALSRHCVLSREWCLQVCRVEGSMDFSCSLDGSRDSVKCQVVDGIARAPVLEQTHSYNNNNKNNSSIMKLREASFKNLK